MVAAAAAPVPAAAPPIFLPNERLDSLLDIEIINSMAEADMTRQQSILTAASSSAGLERHWKFRAS
jgi:hypothetical protein